MSFTAPKLTTVAVALGLRAVVVCAADNDGGLAGWTEKLRSGDRGVRIAAARSLLERGAEARAAFPLLVEVLAEDERLDAVIAAEALFARPRDQSKIPGLLRALEFDTKGRVAAAWEISGMGRLDSVNLESALCAALVHPDKHERNFIVLALAMTGVRSIDTVHGLMTVLRDPGMEDPPQRNYKYPRATAALALGLAGPVAKEAIPALREGLMEKGVWEIQVAANRFALGRLAGERQKAAESTGGIDSLRRALREGPSRINPRVVAGLRALGEYAGTTKPIAKPGRRGGAPPVHESISLAIGYVDALERPPSPVEIVEQDKAGALAAATRMYVMALGGIQQGIVPVLLEALSRAEENPRVMAIRALGALGPAAKPATADLRSALGDVDWVVRREAFLTLERIGRSQEGSRPESGKPAAADHDSLGR